MIVGIAGDNGRGGSAGVGKGEVARVLVDKFGFARVSFADEIKRTIRRWWPNFTVEECWGPSEMRSIPHPEYGGLTVRRAAQLIGTDVGRTLDPNVWVRYGMDIARSLLAGGCWYSPVDGLAWSSSARRPDGVCFDDERFPNEFEAVHVAGGKNWKVFRASPSLEGEAGAHKSENALDGYDSRFDAIIVNNKSLADLDDIVCRIATATL